MVQTKNVIYNISFRITHIALFFLLLTVYYISGISESL